MNYSVSHLFEHVPADAQKILNDFDAVVQSVRPLSSKQFIRLPEDIRMLSHHLTDERSGRRAGYLNETASLSAYVRYFQWWNLVRLTRLFAGLGAECFDIPDDGVCLDIGSGPLTVPIALWLARPELRKKHITWYCLDYSQNALAFGEDLYLAAAARTLAAGGMSASDISAGDTVDAGSLWKIVRVKGEIGTQIRRRADFISCANMFNEAVQTSGKPPEFTAKKAAADLTGYAAAGARILVVEPGIPPAARFLFALREALFRKKCAVLAPCPAGMQHAVFAETGAPCTCPMDARRGGKWCHFVFSTDDAPAKLLKLSASAGIPKDRAALSFLLVRTETAVEPIPTRPAVLASHSGRAELRIASDPIRLPGGRTGYYACSRLGLTLAVERKPFSAEKPAGMSGSAKRPVPPSLKTPASGDLIDAPLPKYLKTDAKSGAVIVELL